MASLLAATSMPMVGNVLEIKDSSIKPVTSIKLRSMSIQDYARYKKSCGRGKRKKNRLNFAKAAKFKRRKLT